MKEKELQTARLLDYMKRLPKGVGITQREAINDLGIYRLASRICDLKQSGIPIQSQFKKVKTRYGETSVKEYWLGGKDAR